MSSKMSTDTAPPANLASLPLEILLPIVEFLLEDPRPPSIYNTETYTPDQAALARTCRRLYDVVNPLIYQRNVRDKPLDSCILRAAHKGSLDTIKRAVAFGADLDVCGIRPQRPPMKKWRCGFMRDPPSSLPARMAPLMATPLHIALRHNHRHIVEYLLQQGVNFQIYADSLPGPRGMVYALETALLESDIPDAPHMLAEHGACLLSEGITALDRAIEQLKDKRYDGGNGLIDDDLVALLLKQRGVEATAAGIKYAAFIRDFELMENLISRPEFDASFAFYKNRPRDYYDFSGRTAIHYAAEANAPLHIIKLLFQRKEANIAAVDVNGHTALHDAAAYLKSKEALDLMIKRPERELMAWTKGDHRQDMPQQTPRATPLHHAARYGNAEAVAVLLKQPDIDAFVADGSGAYPIHLAAGSGSVEAVKVILESEAGDATTLDEKSKSTLHHAAEGPDTEETWAIVDELIRRGADPNSMTPQKVQDRNTPPLMDDRGPLIINGETAFDSAIKRRRFRTAMTLMSHGSKAKWSSEESDSFSLAHHVLFRPNDLAEELLAHIIACGVDTNHYLKPSHWGPEGKPIEGIPFLHALFFSKSLQCMRMLLENGPNVNVPQGFNMTNPKGGAALFFSMLTSVFRHEYGESCERNSVGDVMDPQISERVCLLLEIDIKMDQERKRDHGFWEPSALRWACLAASRGMGLGCLNLLMEKASRRHVSEDHVVELIEEYKWYDSFGEVDMRPGRIARTLEEFWRREFGVGDADNKRACLAQEKEVVCS